MKAKEIRKPLRQAPTNGRRGDSVATRTLLLSDTHGRLHPQILDLALQVDYIVHAGDIGHPAVLNQLADTGATLVIIRGNNDTPDRWPVEGRDRLAALGDTAGLSLPGGELAVEHGHRANPLARRHDVLRQRHPTARLIVYGHSHRQLIDDTSEPWIANPGAGGRSRTYGGSGCILLTASQDEWSLATFQFPLAHWKT